MVSIVCPTIFAVTSTQIWGKADIEVLSGAETGVGPVPPIVALLQH